MGIILRVVEDETVPWGTPAKERAAGVKAAVEERRSEATMVFMVGILSQKEKMDNWCER